MKKEIFQIITIFQSQTSVLPMKLLRASYANAKR